MTKTDGRLLALLALVLLCPRAAHAQGALPFSGSYSITGNYAVGSVDLAPQHASNGLVTGTVSMNGVPANADILAAFLYWETIWTDAAQLSGAKFRGRDVTLVRASEQALDPRYSACHSSGGGSGAAYTMTMFRADVRGLLPRQLDADGNPTGKRLVNDADLVNNGELLHTVSLPDAGNGNQVPQTAGATLVVVYRHPDPTEPLRKIVLYDGIYIQPRARR